MGDIKYYHKWPHELENVEAFKKFVARNPNVEFFQPSPIAAPWHVQAEVNGTLLSFWPHKLKGRAEGTNEKTRGGRRHLQMLVDRALRDEDFAVID